MKKWIDANEIKMIHELEDSKLKIIYCSKWVKLKSEIDLFFDVHTS